MVEDTQAGDLGVGEELAVPVGRHDVAERLASLGLGMLVYVSSTSSSAALQSPTVTSEQPKGREVFTEVVAREFSWRLLGRLDLIMTASKRKKL